MDKKTTVIRVLKNSRRTLRAISAIQNESMLSVFERLVAQEADIEREKNPQLWDEFYSRTADKDEAE